MPDLTIPRLRKQIFRHGPSLGLKAEADVLSPAGPSWRVVQIPEELAVHGALIHKQLLQVLRQRAQSLHNGRQHLAEDHDETEQRLLGEEVGGTWDSPADA